MLANPSPGHTPVLVCVGPTEAEYEPVWPPTLMMNKATATDERHQTMTWGAAQLGIAQGVLDAVADGLLEATGDLLVLVAVWVDPGASDETAVRTANREAVRKAIDRCVEGRDPGGRGRARRAARRADEPVLRRPLMRITGVETRRYRYPLDPPFRAAWDPIPRAPGRDARARPPTPACGLRERRPPARPRAARALPRRPRPAAQRGGARDLRDRRLPRRAAVDGRVRGLGSRRPAARTRRSGACSAAATSACSRTPRAASWSTPTSARARAVALRERGVRALKLRFHHADWREDVAVVEHVRAAVGDDFELMVDANQGWRMPGDREARWDVADRGALRARARAARRVLARGAAALRRRRGLPRAARG